jgi:hypothetical protein
MDFNKLIARVKAILMTPRTEWPVIAAEATTAGDIYKNYVVWLAGIAALASFVGNSIIGHSMWILGTYRVGVGAGLTHAVLNLAMALVFTWLFAWLIDALAPTFGGQKNRVQALKAAAYSFTAGWVASIAQILPVLGGLIALAGLIYGIYLLYVGLPQTMKCPPEKSAAYTAVSVVIAIVAGWILFAVFWGILARTGFMGMGMGMGGFGGLTGMSREGGGFDADSNGGRLGQWAKSMEAAGKQAELAGKSGNPAAAAQAAGGVLAAALSGGKGAVEALPPDRMKSFLPETLGGLARTEVSAQRNGAVGIQVSEAEARYTDNAGQNIRLKVADLGGAAGFAALASWANVEVDRQTQTGYEKTYKSGGRMVHEQWDGSSKDGQYTVLVGERFSVEASGSTTSIDVLKSAVNSIDLGGLEALRNEGVKAN